MASNTISKLIFQELLSRKEAEQELLERKEKIKQLIEQNCIKDPKAYIFRGQIQRLCFKHIFNLDKKPPIPFTSYINQIMPELGFPLGFAYNKQRVYRGLKWKSK